MFPISRLNAFASCNHLSLVQVCLPLCYLLRFPLRDVYPPFRIKEIDWYSEKEDTTKNACKNTFSPSIAMLRDHRSQAIRASEGNDVLRTNNDNDSWARVLRPSLGSKSRCYD